ncbi:MAG TPA: B12-binding domain-containing protein [Thermoleophilia bacterium]|nr:B12-binding domain-containing protein [Thermoleophilia bacterium]
MSTLDALVLAVQDGDAAQAGELAGAALEEGADVTAMVERLSAGMREVGDQFATGDVFLPELMLAARAMQSAMTVLQPRLLESAAATVSHGVIVVGTVKGDVHEIGKDIAITMLRAAGFEVHDLGRDVNALDFVRRAEDLRADVIGASALMTTTMPAQKELVDILVAKGLREKYHVILGGAPVTPEWVAEAGADSWGEDAGTAVKVLERAMADKAANAEG